jgi:hypothetical protein
VRQQNKSGSNGRTKYEEKNTVEQDHVRQVTMSNSSRQPKHVSLVYLIGQFEVPHFKQSNLTQSTTPSNVLHQLFSICKCSQLAIQYIWSGQLSKPVHFELSDCQLTHSIRSTTTAVTFKFLVNH